MEGTAFDRHELLARRLRENAKLDHSPGDEYAYSNLSYWLLEAAIERASGMDCARYVQEKLLAPLGVDARQASFADSGVLGSARRALHTARTSWRDRG